MVSRVRAVILAGGEGTRLGVLTTKRAKPAVPFAGKYRIIDFPLSNCVNSGIFDVLVLTQYRPHSLNEHVGLGRPWDLDRSFSGGVQLLQPYKGRFDTDWYLGTADAVTQNLNFVRRGHPDYTLLLSGDHIYAMDYRPLIDQHRDLKADVSICVMEVPWDEASRFGIVFTDENQRIQRFYEKPNPPPGNLANMGIYLFNTEVLLDVLSADAKNPDSSHDFGKDILPKMITDGFNMVAYPFNDYWVDVGTTEAYWQAHMDLLQASPPINLNDRSWVMHTRSEERAPVQIQAGAVLRDSLVTNGCVISSNAIVERSVLSPGVYVGPGAVVRESILLNDVYIEGGAVVERVVSDKQVNIGHNARVGRVDPNAANFGLTTLGKNADVPAETLIGTNVIIGTDATRAHFQEKYPDGRVPDGARVYYRGPDK
jgi:glucose-1-phosphate adenylyltransferase